MPRHSGTCLHPSTKEPGRQTSVKFQASQDYIVRALGKKRGSEGGGSRQAWEQLSSAPCWRPMAHSPNICLEGTLPGACPAPMLAEALKHRHTGNTHPSVCLPCSPAGEADGLNDGQHKLNSKDEEECHEIKGAVGSVSDRKCRGHPHFLREWAQREV